MFIQMLASIIRISQSRFSESLGDAVRTFRKRRDTRSFLHSETILENRSRPSCLRCFRHCVPSRSVFSSSQKHRDSFAIRTLRDFPLSCVYPNSSFDGGFTETIGSSERNRENRRRKRSRGSCGSTLRDRVFRACERGCTVQPSRWRGATSHVCTSRSATIPSISPEGTPSYRVQV